MPNIIEQQDLLKGLTDQRLAGLMQQPTGDIPPFLVAAEAQRRAAVRQQFAAQGPQESVVDSLTKQMASVPTDIGNAPNLPAPGGIGALPAGMAGGGMVRRYAPGGFVLPPGMTRQQYEAMIEKQKIDAMPDGPAKYRLQHPTVPKTEQQKAEDELYAATEGPLSWMSTPGDQYDAAQKLKDVEDRKADADVSIDAGTSTTTYPDIMSGVPDTKLPKNKVEEKPKPTTGTEGTSLENKWKAKEAELRKRVEALYSGESRSNWDDSAKWFAAAAQFLNPEYNLAQSFVGAAGAWVGTKADEERAAREQEMAGQEALLKWDMDAYQYERDAAASAATKASDRAFELEKLSQLRPGDALSGYESIIKTNTERLKDVDNPPSPAERDALVQQINAAQIAISNIMGASGYGVGKTVTRDQLPSAGSFEFK